MHIGSTRGPVSVGIGSVTVVDIYFTQPTADAAAGDVVHRLPDDAAQLGPEQRRVHRRLQGRHPQEVEREDRGAETKRTGKQLPFFIPT